MATKHKKDIFTEDDDDSTDSEEDEPVQKRQKMSHACDNCGALFKDKKSLDHHEEKCEEVDEEGDETVWSDILQGVVEDNKDMYSAKVEAYMTDGFSDDDAKKRTLDDMYVKYMNDLKNEYKTLLMNIQGLEKSHYHEKILKAVELFEKSGNTYEKAVKLAIKKNNFIFDRMVESLDVSDEEEKTDTEETDTEEENEDKEEENEDSE